MDINTLKDSLYYYKAAVISVYDGDTCTVNIDLGFNCGFHKMHIRLSGIDAPEIKSENAQSVIESRDFLKNLIIGKEVYLQSHKDKSDKYGRYLATIWVLQNDNLVCVNNLLVSSGHAIFKSY